MRRYAVNACADVISITTTAVIGAKSQRVSRSNKLDSRTAHAD
jgi:hypothetical protein